MFKQAHGRFPATLTIVALMLAIYSLINGRFEVEHRAARQARDR